MKRYKKRYMPVNTAQNEHWGMANAPDLGRKFHLLSSVSKLNVRTLSLIQKPWLLEYHQSGIDKRRDVVFIFVAG